MVPPRSPSFTELSRNGGSGESVVSPPPTDSGSTLAHQLVR
jgi:hypothetical protein